MTTLINNKYKADTLIDTNNTDYSFISEKLARLFKLKATPIPLDVGMAAASLSSQSSGYCVVNLTVQSQLYSNVKLHLLRGLCTDIILGTDFQEQHESITITYGGSKPPITSAALTCIKTEPPELFAHLILVIPLQTNQESTPKVIEIL